MRLALLTNLLMAVALGALRVLGMKHIAFQAVAHLYVGGLLGAWWVGRDRWLLWIAVGLSVVEVVCFFVLR